MRKIEIKRQKVKTTSWIFVLFVVLILFEKTNPISNRAE
jgi:hypothetical protein